MACTYCSDFSMCIGVSLWTLIQAALHIWWVISGRFMLACKFTIKLREELLFYITYYYSDECPKSPIQEYINYKNNITDLNYKLLNSIQHEDTPLLVLPSYSDAVTLTDKLMILYLILDVLWLISSVSLLTGTICKIKEFSAILFFGPWIGINIASMALDIFTAIYFGLHIPTAEYITEFLTLSRVPQEAYKQQYKFKDLDLPPQAILAILAGRLGIIWLLNLIFLIIISKGTWTAWRKNYSDETKPKLVNNNSTGNTTEARIKSWQLFYGTLDANSAPKEDTNRNDLSYNQTFKELEEYNKYKRKSQQFDVTSNHEDLCSTFKSNGQQSFEQSNQEPEVRTINSELRSQMPWSYIQSQSSYNKDQSSKSNHEKRVVVMVPSIRKASIDFRLSFKQGNHSEETTSQC